MGMLRRAAEAPVTAGSPSAPGVHSDPDASARGGGPPGPRFSPQRRGLAIAVLALTDWAAVAVSLLASWEVRQHLLRPLVPGLGDLLLSRSEYFRTLYFLLPWTIAFAEVGLYSGRVLLWEEARRSLRACTLAAVFAALVVFAIHASTRLSRLVLLGTWLGSVVLVPVARHLMKRLLAAIGWWRHRALILGAGETGLDVLARVRRHPALGTDAVAFVDDDPTAAAGRGAGLPVVGPLADVPRFVREFHASEVLVALPRLPRERLLRVIAACEGQVASIRLVPDMFGLATVGVETEDLDGLLLLHIRWNLAKPWNLAIKRVFDLLVSAVLGAALLPLLLLAALAIRLGTPGPALFRQQRLGRGGRTFACIKFRTMYVDAAARLERHFAAHPEARADWERFAKLKSGDPRVTPLGRWLRRTSLDELPQLINVLRGEMSLVGPRPYLPQELERLGDFAETILKAPPGITGLWQVSGRNELTFQQRLRLDEYYVRNWSLWLDVIVLIKTLRVVTGAGAY